MQQDIKCCVSVIDFQTVFILNLYRYNYVYIYYYIFYIISFNINIW